jgi:hypothetical protein
VISEANRSPQRRRMAARNFSTFAKSSIERMRPGPTTGLLLP